MVTRTAVSVIGLGGMGKGMAARLLAAEHPVTVWNRTASAADELVLRGAGRAASPAEAVTPGGIVITMVANDAALEAVTTGAAGLLEGLGQGGVHLSMSTVSPALADSLAERHTARGSHYLAAPVFGRPAAAATGKLWIAIAGPAAAKERARPVLEVLGQSVYDFGERPAAANVAKLGGNFLIAAAIEAMGEAFALMAKRGVDGARFHQLVAETNFACPIYQNYGRFILDRAFDPPGFKLELGLKDVGLALAAGAESRTPMPLASLLRDRFLAAMAQGRGNSDWTAIAALAAEDAGLEG
jgi:3-hydroxyisobutyrate dehydrogenase-like beta-hydroxyacid dehydrogenase